MDSTVFRRHFLFLVVLWCRVSPIECSNRSLSFGVCYTRNMVLEKGELNMTDASRKLRNVVLSATSAKRSGVPLCLFTDLDEEHVREICAGHDAPRDLFDIILDDGLPEFSPRSEQETVLVSGSSGILKERKIKILSRIGRIINLGRGPFEMTLFVDDDTFFCGSHSEELVEALGELHKRREDFPIRGKVFAKRYAEDMHMSESLRCVWRHADTSEFSASLHTKCLDRVGQRDKDFCSGAQGGAFAVASGSKAVSFAQQWKDAYLDYYVDLMAKDDQWKNKSTYAARSFGGDQTPLSRLMERQCANASSGQDNTGAWTFGALPSSFNVRDADRPNMCATPIFGPLLLLHHKRYVSQGTVAQASSRLDSLCSKLNRDHERGGAVWIGTRTGPLFDENARCSWMRHHSAPDSLVPVTSLGKRGGGRGQQHHDSWKTKKKKKTVVEPSPQVLSGLDALFSNHRRRRRLFGLFLVGGLRRSFD